MINNIIVSDRKFDQDKIDILITACGYEQRCTEIAKEYNNIALNKLSFQYSSRNLLNYDVNLKWYISNGFTLICFEKDNSYHAIIENVCNKIDSDQVISIMVDYSSMCRNLIANLISILNKASIHRNLDVHFVYTPAEYYEPNDIQTEILISEPVIPLFSGKLMPPNMPTVALLGLGYEAERALGLMEYLEPGAIRTFFPTGADSRFDDKVKELNLDFFEFIGEKELQSYDVNKPFQLFKQLESVCYGVLQWGRPIFIPLGPKPFTICSLIVSCLFDYEPVVWRVSGGQNSLPIDRVRNGDFVWLSVRFNRQIDY